MCNNNLDRHTYILEVPMDIHVRMSCVSLYSHLQQHEQSLEGGNSWQRSRTHSSRCSSPPSGSRVSRSQNTHQKREQTLSLSSLHWRVGRRGHLVGGGEVRGEGVTVALSNNITEI